MNKFKTFLVALVTFILQVTLFSKIEIFGSNINLILALVVSLSQILGVKSGSNVGLILGLLEDLLFSKLIGVRALSYFWIAYIVGSDRFNFSKDKRNGGILTFVFTFTHFLLVNLVYYTFNQAGFAFQRAVILPLLSQAILNVLVYLLYYKIIKKIMYVPTYRI